MITNWKQELPPISLLNTSPNHMVQSQTKAQLQALRDQVRVLKKEKADLLVFSSSNKSVDSLEEELESTREALEQVRGEEISLARHLETRTHELNETRLKMNGLLDELEGVKEGVVQERHLFEGERERKDQAWKEEKQALVEENQGLIQEKQEWVVEKERWLVEKEDWVLEKQGLEEERAQWDITRQAHLQEASSLVPLTQEMSSLQGEFTSLQEQHADVVAQLASLHATHALTMTHNHSLVEENALVESQRSTLKQELASLLSTMEQDKVWVQEQQETELLQARQAHTQLQSKHMEEMANIHGQVSLALEKTRRVDEENQTLEARLVDLETRNQTLVEEKKMLAQEKVVLEEERKELEGTMNTQLGIDKHTTKEQVTKAVEEKQAEFDLVCLENQAEMSRLEGRVQELEATCLQIQADHEREVAHLSNLHIDHLSSMSPREDLEALESKAVEYEAHLEQVQSRHSEEMDALETAHKLDLEELSTQHAASVLSLQEEAKLQGSKDDTEINSLLVCVARLEDALEEKTQSLDLVKEELESTIEEYHSLDVARQQGESEVVSVLQAQLRKAEQSLVEEVARLQRGHLEALEEETKLHAKEMEEVKGVHEEEKEEVKRVHEKEMAEVRRMHEEEVVVLQQTHVEDLQVQLEEATRENSLVVATLEASHVCAVENIQKTHITQVSSLEEALVDLEASHKHMLDDLQTSHQQILQDTNTSHVQELDKAHSLNLTLESTIKSLESSLTTAETTHTERVTALEASSSSLLEQNQQATLKLAELKEDFANAILELNKVQEDKEQASRDVATMSAEYARLGQDNAMLREDQLVYLEANKALIQERDVLGLIVAQIGDHKAQVQDMSELLTASKLRVQELEAQLEVALEARFDPQLEDEPNLAHQHTNHSVLSLDTYTAGSSTIPPFHTCTRLPLKLALERRNTADDFYEEDSRDESTVHHELALDQHLISAKQVEEFKQVEELNLQVQSLHTQLKEVMHENHTLRAQASTCFTQEQLLDNNELLRESLEEVGEECGMVKEQRDDFKDQLQRVQAALAQSQALDLDQKTRILQLSAQIRDLQGGDEEGELSVVHEQQTSLMGLLHSSKLLKKDQLLEHISSNFSSLQGLISQFEGEGEEGEGMQEQGAEGERTKNELDVQGLPVGEEVTGQDQVIGRDRLGFKVKLLVCLVYVYRTNNVRLREALSEVKHSIRMGTLDSNSYLCLPTPLTPLHTTPVHPRSNLSMSNLTPILVQPDNSLYMSGLADSSFSTTSSLDFSFDKENSMDSASISSTSSSLRPLDYRALGLSLEEVSISHMSNLNGLSFYLAVSYGSFKLKTDVMNGPKNVFPVKRHVLSGK